MAESFIFSIAESLIAKLASQAFEEASRVVGLYDNLRDLKQTLSLVKAVLLDAEQKQEQNHELREWLRQLKRVFSDAEDVLDEFECQTLRKQVVKAHGTIKDEVSHFFSCSNPLVFRSKMAQQIKDVSMRLDKVAADRNKFHLETIDVGGRVVNRREMTHSSVRDSDVIGRKHDKEKIIELLMQQNPDHDDATSLSVIPIVGIGGLGKTTLAKFVFNDKRICESFPLKMWVCVSDDFDIKQLIIKIINSANDFAVVVADAPLRQLNLNMVDLEQLQNQLTNKLAGQKSLLVLDDVWNDDRVKWVELRNLIQVAAVGSKILVTTRSHSVASMMSTVPSHILDGLSLENSLSLFVKWAFKEGEEEKHPHLVNIGKEIVKKCRGVPLAVRTLGSLLFSKFEAHEWEYVRDNEIWNLPQKKDDILPALKLSYDLLPSHLRQCFALFSLYPKDYKFFSYEVSMLWGALGLLALPRKNETPEDVAKQYMYELLSRSFLQDFDNMGTIYRFKMHDLVHDLALFVAKDECLLINSHIQNIPESVRHLSFAEDNFLGNLSTTKLVAVRTILFPNGAAGANVEALLNTCVSNFKSLRVLDLSYSACKTLSRSIGKLKHLRYFNIMNNHNIKRLPNSVIVGSCVNLDLELWKDHHEEQSPKLKLKFVEFGFLPQLVALPEWLQETAYSLQTLSIFRCDNFEMLSEWLSTLTNLKTLLITDCPKLLSLPENIHNLTVLERLWIEGCPELCRKCQPHVGEPWSKISHIKDVFIEEQEELEEEEDEKE